MNHTLSAIITFGALAMTALAEDAPVLSPLQVDGANFTIQTLGSDKRAYGNRKYKWRDVPKRFEGWQYTQTDGGRQALIRFTAPSGGIVFATTSERYRHIMTEDWKRVPKCSFWYTDGGKTRMGVYRRVCKAGERVAVPQGNWNGGILLAPKLTMGEGVEVIYPPPPGVVISRTPDPKRVFVGSPSIAILPDGSYVASHDWFGGGSAADTTAVFACDNRGITWTKLTEIKGLFWATLFVHKGKLYAIGAGKLYGPTVIRRSDDGGRTWTTPDSPKSGLLLDGDVHHCAPVPVVFHAGRVWRAMEDILAGGGWGRHFRAFVMSAPEDADLLDAANWTFSNRLPFDRAWGDTSKAGWLEGNVVVGPAGELLNVLRYQSRDGEQAAVVRVSADGKRVTFDPKSDIIRMPGGRHKFTIRFDPVSKRYWSLVNKSANPQAVRNVLALISSDNVRDWRVDSVLLMHPDTGNHAFQYVDWQFDDADIIAVSRTAYGDSRNFHDANYLTFHRVRGFRTDKRTLK